MRIVPININSKASIREKARLNICIARDLTDSFGGRKADYLIRLNRKLKMFNSSFKYRDKSKLECHLWNSPAVESRVDGVGWALPTFNR